MTPDSIVEKIETSRKDLLELSLRNPLLNYKLLRAKGVEAVGADPAKVFRTLVHNNGSMRFIDAESKSRANNRIRTTATSSDELEKRLLKTYYDANTLIQEQGVNTLFVALGMVHWYEADSSEIERKAPLILVPVRLERANVNAGFSIKYSGEELGANIVFMQKAQNDFGIRIPDLPDDEENDAEEMDVTAYFSDVSRSIKDMKRWRVENESVVLGFFSFSKLLMYRDLDPGNWPEGSGPLENHIIRNLFEGGFKEPTSAISEDAHLDEHIKPQEVFHVVDADSSQAKAIYDVNSGRNLIIQGPPGTGKSQTITNIIAEGIAQEKKILFVSEKMAALEVVKRRLDNIDLGDACLELHSHKTQKRAVIDELKRTLELGEPNTDGIADDFDALAQHQDRLNEYAKAVNTHVGDTGITPYHAYGELIRIRVMQGDRHLPQLRTAGLAFWTNADFQRKGGIVSELQTILESMDIPKEHVFRGSRLHLVTPLSEADLRDGITATIKSLDALTETAPRLCDTLGLSAPDDIAQVEAILPLAEHAAQAPIIKGVNLRALEPRKIRSEMWKLLHCHERSEQLHSEYDAVLKPEAWESDVSEAHQILSTTGRSFWGKLFSSEFPRAKSHMATLHRNELPRDVEQQIVLAKAILDEQQIRRDIAKLSPTAIAVLGQWWQAEHSDWIAIRRIVEWAIALLDDVDNRHIHSALAFAMSDDIDASRVCETLEQAKVSLESHRKRIAELENSLELDNARQFGNADGLTALPFIKQRDVLTEWAGNMDKVRSIAEFNRVASTASQEELSEIVELVREWQEASTHLKTCFDNARYNAILSRAIEERSSLAGFNADVHQQTIGRFRRMDELSLEHNRSRVAHIHWSKLPMSEGGGQLGILKREFAKKRRHLHIRQLMERAGNAVQAIKPVFMMSPLSVATYLKPGGVKFDLVVFDEASQVKPVEALGALMRADQTVVVGDDKQLPPTNFFNAAIQGDDDDDVATSNIESILSLFSAQGAPSRMLRWHYRSRHESLIAVSNSEFYENRLIVFPSPDKEKQDLGLRYHWLDTKYEGGGVNREEARAVAWAVMEHASQHPDLSLGVATFSASQRDAVQDALELFRRQNDTLEPFFNAHPDEPFFVKNLENVQGDERDVVFISVGYGRSGDGRVRQNFGPLNNDGGERRLNVLISRAKQRCHVFTNLHADDIRLTANSRLGVQAFKKFLAYAEHGEILDMPTASGREAASPFQKEVADRLRSHGYEIHDEVESSGFFVDIGVVDPKHQGRYVLGIECDGATYHSSQSARDRDRLREQVLMGLGWRLHRIWSTNWFNNPDLELQRAIKAIEDALVPQNENKSHTKSTVSAPIQRSDAGQENRKPDIPPYELAQPSINTGAYNLAAAPIHYLIEPVVEVVSVESPIHKEQVIRRIATAAGANIGKKIRRNLNRVFDDAVRRNAILRKGDFLWAKDMEHPRVRDRSELPAQQKNVEHISPEEIDEAIRLVVESSYGIDRGEAVKETANLLGFGRVTKNVSNKLGAAVDRMEKDKRLKVDNEHLTLSE